VLLLHRLLLELLLIRLRRYWRLLLLGLLKLGLVLLRVVLRSMCAWYGLHGC
jgi:hypothetical protein